MIKSVLLILSVISLVISQGCQPLYWEVDPTYKVVTNEVEQYSKNTLNPGPVSTTVKQNLTSITYELNNIVGKQTYDGSKVVIIGNGSDLITVNNNHINISLTYNANKSGSATVKEYKGTGSAVVDKLQINFTKKLTYKENTVSFELAKLNFNLPNAVQPNKFVPEPTAKENTTFFNLATDDLYIQLKELIGSGLNMSLTNILKNESFGNPFGGQKYEYTYNGLLFNFSSHMNNVTFMEGNGLLVGYNMTINNWTAPCSQWQPTDYKTKASYITNQLIGLIFNYATTYYEGWRSMKLDASNTNSDVFQFYMFDLEEVIPDALIKYPSLLTRTEAYCSLLPSQTTYELDKLYKLIRIQSRWACNLYIANTKTLLMSMQPQVSHELRLVQEGSRLRSSVVNSNLIGVDFGQVDDFPIKNLKLATLYVKSLLGTMSKFDTFGTNFVQPARKSPSFDWTDQYIRITDGAKANLRFE